MNEKLNRRKCIPCEAGTIPLTRREFSEYLSQISGWEVSADKEIRKIFQFRNFSEAIEFVNKVARISEEEGHHPNIKVYNYKFVEISLSTHDIGGLSENDFILASKIDKI